MQDIERPRQPTPEEIRRMRPSGGFLLLGAPIVGIILVFLAYAWLLYNGWIGRPATGPQVTYEVQGCPESVEVITSRIGQMGLPDPVVTAVPGGFTLAVSLPDADTDPEALGQTLGARGLFAMRGGAGVLVTQEHIDHAGVRLDMTMTPATLVVLTPEGRDVVYEWMDGAPEERTSIELEGVEVWSFNNRKTTMNGEFEIPPDAEDERSRMGMAAARGIVLNDGPLPCDVVISVVPQAP